MLGQESLHSNLVYPLLQRFVSEGMVKQKTEPGERGQTRKIYSLTSLGRRTLMEKITQFGEQDAESESAFHMRVGFFPLLAAEVRARVLAAREAALERHDQRMEGLQQAMELGVYGAEIIQHRRERIKAELNWVARLRQLQRKVKGKEK
jgi:DNA-binding PadR family transcriptional regulator